MKHVTKYCKSAFIIFVTFLSIGKTGIAHSTTTASGCNGANCRGKDPVAAGCTKGAVNLATRTQGGVRIELRYSARCNSKWVRVTNLSGSQSSWTQASLSPWQDSVNVIEQKQVVWSKMWSGKGIAACGAPHPDSQMTPEPICTAAK